MRAVPVIATTLASLGLALLFVAATFGTVAACASAAPTPTPIATMPPPPPTPTALAPTAFVVRQKAASDFGCKEDDVGVVLGSPRGTLLPGHSREVWTATGCGKSADYVAVCALDEDGSRVCNAVAASGNAEQMSPYGE